ncbi:exosporium protein D [Priestia sp. SB1]|uniref:exosporium protein D n=1 Tax=Priestia TaxID=2800373 RepID=UPI001CFBA9A3|nr:exosporium protein D [Priestia aryabhattai]NGY85366.1 exosporium protein D [Priestia megaterium]WJN47651.1 exosporium protein D [Priestia aryabhattai]
MIIIKSYRHHNKNDEVYYVEAAYPSKGSYNKKKENEKFFIENHTIEGSGTNLTGNIPLTIAVPANAIDVTVFEDFTRNHNKTLLQLSAAATGVGVATGLTVSIFVRGSRLPISATIPAGSTRAFQVENFEKLTVSNPSATTAGTLNVFIQKTFCIGCNSQNKKSNKGCCF